MSRVLSIHGFVHDLCRACREFCDARSVETFRLLGSFQSFPKAPSSCRMYRAGSIPHPDAGSFTRINAISLRERAVKAETNSDRVQSSIQKDVTRRTVRLHLSLIPNPPSFFSRPFLSRLTRRFAFPVDESSAVQGETKGFLGTRHYCGKMGGAKAAL